jgi:PTS system ascorbate-specific IIA component
MLLKEIVEQNRAQFIEKAEDWEDAIKKSCKLLIAEGIIDPGYAEEIVAAVHELGPYIVLTPGFALPHAMKNSEHVHGTAIAFMKLAEPVSFAADNPDKDASVFFTLAARDSEEHLKNMRKLWTMLTDEELCAELRNAASIEELLELDKKYSGAASKIKT